MQYVSQILRNSNSLTHLKQSLMQPGSRAPPSPSAHHTVLRLTPPRRSGHTFSRAVKLVQVRAAPGFTSSSYASQPRIGCGCLPAVRAQKMFAGRSILQRASRNTPACEQCWRMRYVRYVSQIIRNANALTYLKQSRAAIHRRSRAVVPFRTSLTRNDACLPTLISARPRRAPAPSDERRRRTQLPVSQASHMKE